MLKMSIKKRIVFLKTKVNIMKNSKFCLTQNERELITLADEMASSMANLNGQTYDTFVTARENLHIKIREMCDHHQCQEERIAAMKKAVEAA